MLMRVVHSSVFDLLASGSLTSNFASSSASQNDSSVSTPERQKMEPCKLIRSSQSIILKTSVVAFH